MFSRILDVTYTVLGVVFYYTKYKKSCYLPTEQVEKNQYKKLKKLLELSYTNIPYYREKYDLAGFNPFRDFQCLEDFKKVPMLTKLEAREQGAALKNPKYRGPTVEFKTSGSTGHPYTATVSWRHWVLEQGVIWRHWKWAGYKFRDPLAILRSFAPGPDEPLIKADRFRNFHYFSPFHLTDEKFPVFIAEMNRLKVKFVRGYPSTILSLSLYLEHHPEVKIPTLIGALVASEVLSDKDRVTIEKNIGVRVFNHYGLAEQIVMFGDCERHEGLHNYDEYGYVELLDVPDKAEKMIIGTNLNNLAMPLIRYDTGDMAVLNEKPCSCARTSLCIKNIAGRADQAIICEDSHSIPTVNFYTMLEYYEDYYSEWQLIQHSLKEMELILKTHDVEKASEISDKLMQEFQKRLPDYFNVEINLNKPFIRHYEGKKNTFVRNFHAD